MLSNNGLPGYDRADTQTRELPEPLRASAKWMESGGLEMRE